MLVYFEKGTGRRYISTSIKGLAEVLGVHRNSVITWLGGKGFYEDTVCVVFSIGTEELIKGKPRNKFPTGLKGKAHGVTVSNPVVPMMSEAEAGELYPEPVKVVVVKNTKKQREKLAEVRRLVIDHGEKEKSPEVVPSPKKASIFDMMDAVRDIPMEEIKKSNKT